MTGNEAIRMLREVGFHRVRIDKDGHQHWQLGKHRIMISTGSVDLDPTIAFRVKKLCQGSITSRDLQREVHQDKRELPNTIFKIGDPVENIGTRRRGIIIDIDYQQDRAGVDWGGNGEDKDIELEVLLSRLRLSREFPALAQEERTQEEPQLPKQEERAVESQHEGRSASITLLEQLAYLGMAAEDEYNRLIEFREAVVAYERIFDLQEQLGIEIKPLPFKLIDGANWQSQPEPQPEPAIVHPGETVTRTQLSRQKRQTRKPINDTTVEALIREHSGKMYRSVILNHFGWSRRDQTLEILDQMMGLGKIKVTEVSHRGRGAWLCTLTGVGVD